MSNQLTLAILAIQLLTTVVLAIIGYYARRYIVRIDRNTRFRRWVSGDPQFDADGKLDDISSMHDEFEQDIDELKESLQHVKEQCDAIVDVLEQQAEEDIEEPDADFHVTDD
jgi:hypothetical protein